VLQTGPKNTVTGPKKYSQVLHCIEPKKTANAFKQETKKNTVESFKQETKNNKVKCFKQGTGKKVLKLLKKNTVYCFKQKRIQLGLSNRKQTKTNKN
jgi:hypothetical protein